MPFPYTPDDLYEAEKSFAVRHDLPLDALGALRQWRKDVATTLSSELHRIAVWIAVPVLVSFTQWIAAQTGKSENACCLAVMRDGWLPGRFLNAIYGTSVREFWINRDLGMRAAFGCGDDEALLNWLVRTRLQPLSRSMATGWLTGSQYSGPSPHEPLDLDSARQLIAEWDTKGLLSRIRAEGRELAERLLKHWRSTVSMPGAKAFLIDFACAGNVQRSLQTVLAAYDDDAEVIGLNFATTKGAQWAKQTGCSFNGFLAEDGSPEWFAEAYARTPELMEIFTAASYGPLLNYSDNGTPQTGEFPLQSQIEDWRMVEAAIVCHRQLGPRLTADIARCLWGRLLFQPLPAEVATLADWPLDAGLDGAARRVLAPSCEGLPETASKWQSAWPAGSALRKAC